MLREAEEPEPVGTQLIYISDGRTAGLDQIIQDRFLSDRPELQNFSSEDITILGVICKQWLLFLVCIL